MMLLGPTWLKSESSASSARSFAARPQRNVLRPVTNKGNKGLEARVFPTHEFPFSDFAAGDLNQLINPFSPE